MLFLVRSVVIYRREGTAPESQDFTSSRNVILSLPEV